MRYAAARFDKDWQELAYRIYITDALRIMTENTSKTEGGQYLTQRWYDFIDRSPVDTRTPQEVIGNISDKLKKLGGEQNGSV